MDPRVERTKEHVLNCARTLLDEQGPEGLTFSSVGKAARVARQTLYRHWTTREQLIEDVLLTYSGHDRRRPTGKTPEDHLTAYLEHVREQMSAPAIASATALLLSHATTDAGSAETLRIMVSDSMNSVRSGWGPLSYDEWAMIIGPVVAQAMVLRRPLTDHFLAELVAQASARSARADVNRS